MHIPGALCTQLHRLHPKLRFAWMGRERQHVDELNAGSFAVIQLYHIRDAGTSEEPNTYFQHWDDSFGVIFNKTGGANRDWDPVFYKPILVARLEDFGITTGEVFSGKVLQIFQTWIEWQREKKVIQHRKNMNKEMTQKLDDLGSEITDYLWSIGSHTSETSINDISWKHSKAGLEESLAKGAHRRSELEHYYDVPYMNE